MSANRPKSTPPLGARMNGWDGAMQAQPPPAVVRPTPYRYLSPSRYHNGATTGLRRTTTPDMHTHLLSPTRATPERRLSYSEGGTGFVQSQMDHRVIPRNKNPGGRQAHGSQRNRASDSLQYYYTSRHASQQSTHSAAYEVQPKSPEATWVPRDRLPDGTRYLSPSHTSYCGGSQAGYVTPGVFELPGYQSYLNSLWETQSVLSNDSGGTQSSEISEPTFKRPKPRPHPHHPYPLGTTGDTSHHVPRPAYGRHHFSRGEAWHMEEEPDVQPRRSSKTVGHVDEAMIASRIPPHYFHLHNPPSSHSHSPTSSLSSSRAGSQVSLPFREIKRWSVGPPENRPTSPTAHSSHYPRRSSYSSPSRHSSTPEKRPPEKRPPEGPHHSRRIVNISVLEHRPLSPTQAQERTAGVPASPSVPQQDPQSYRTHLHHHQPSTQPPSNTSTNNQRFLTESEIRLQQEGWRQSQGSPTLRQKRSKTKSSPSLRFKLGTHSSDSRLHRAVVTKQSKRHSALDLSEAQRQAHMMSGQSDEPRGMEEKQLELSFSGGSSSPLQKSRGGKSGGGLVFQRLAKRFSKISRKGNSERRNEEKDRESGSAKERHSNAELSDTIDGGGGGETEKKAKSSKKLRPRSSSVSNLESVESPGRRAQSMDNLSPSENKTFDARGFSTPGSTPTGTPSMTRSSSKTKLGRRGSEPDLEGALSSLFRSGSKKNLAMDPSEALFEYIEQGNADGVQQLLEANMIAELNGTNEDDFTPVDAAVMLGHHSIARMLLAKGAKDSAKFCRDPFSRFTRLTALLMDSERELESLKCDLLTVGATSNVRDLEQRLRRWEWRAHLFRKMKAIYEQADPPCPPANVTLHITSNRTLTVRWSEPDQCNKATVTRYKIEWSNSELYAPSMGEFIMTDLRNFDYTIPDLTKGERYYVRVSAFNMKGWGQPRMATPLFAVPSSWHDLDRSQPRFEGCTDKIHTLAAQLSLTLSNSPPLSPTFGAPPTTSSKKSMKKGISKLFGSAVKFQKSLKPGVYIATLVYSDEGKIVVTVDDNIPMVEVSDSRSSSVGADFVWLAKLSCTWDHIRGMKETSDNYTSSPAVLFRNKILTAILSLQGALGMQDLGILHPIPYRDAHGAIVFIIVQYVQDSRSLQGISLKWSTLPRLWKKRTQPLPTADHGGMARDIGSFPVPDQIILDAQDIIAHHCNSTRPLTRGLYLGYLKARSSVASMKVICSREYPNVLPHIKIRENPNISSEEWAWLQSLRSPSSADAQPHPTDPSSQSLQKTLLPTIDTFLHNLRISKENVEKHQLYCHEVIELNENISLILLLPPHDQVCTPPGSTDHFVDLPAFSALPINTFEIMQLYTYQKSFMTRFSMVSARLDIELLTSQQRLREAFSKEEVTQAKHIQTDLESYQEQTDSTWKQMRWIEEALQRGRDPSADTSAVIPIRTLRENVSSHPPNGMTLRRAAMVQTVQRAGPSHGYLRVFPAYNTGLAKGTSVKLYITIKTTTIEVIRLVVQQLEKARYEKGLTDRGLTEDDLSDFYLVCYSGNSEWTLEGGFNPLQLQAQASKCRLFVKRYSEELVIDEQATTV